MTVEWGIAIVSFVAAMVAVIAAGRSFRDARRMRDMVTEARQDAAYWRLQAALAARDLPWPHDPRTAEPPVK